MSFQAMTWAVEQQCPDSQSKLLLLMLANHAGSHEDAMNTCWPSIKLLSEECSMSEDTVSRRLEVLRTLKLVKITGRAMPDGRQTSNLYTLPVPVKTGKVAPAGSPPPPRWERPSPPLAAGRTSNTNQSFNRGTTRSIMDLKDIIEAKNKVADDLKRRFTIEVATGTKWQDEAKRQEFIKLKRESRELTGQLAAL